MPLYQLVHEYGKPNLKPQEISLKFCIPSKKTAEIPSPFSHNGNVSTLMGMNVWLITYTDILADRQPFSSF